jgi:hypothetical protein
VRPPRARRNGVRGGVFELEFEARRRHSHVSPDVILLNKLVYLQILSCLNKICSDTHHASLVTRHARDAEYVGGQGR